MKNKDIGEIRIKDIAQKAGVSAGSIDRVLHNRKGVSEATRQKVLDIINELGYKPNLLARTLKTGKAFKIAVLIPKHNNENPYWERPFKGINKALNEMEHYGIALDTYFFDLKKISSFKSQMYRMLMNKPDGIIMVPTLEEEAHAIIEVCKENETPLSLFNTDLSTNKNKIFIGQNAIAAGEMAARVMHLANKEDATFLIINLVYIEGVANHRKNRANGFNDYMKRNMPKAKTRNIIIDNFTEEKIEMALNKEDLNKINGIFVTSSKVYTVGNVLSKLNCKHIMLAGFDTLPQNTKQLENGQISFLIGQQSFLQGYYTMRSMAEKLLYKKNLETHYMPIDVIFKENVEYYKYM